MEAVTRAVENTEYELHEAEEAACLADVEPHAIILTEKDALPMSALPPKADIFLASIDVR